MENKIKEILDQFKNSLSSDVIEEEKIKYNNAEKEIEGVQNLQNYYDEVNRIFLENWEDFYLQNDIYQNADEETKEKIENIDIIDYIF